MKTQIVICLNEYIVLFSSNKCISIFNFREWKNKIISAIEDKNNPLKTKIILRKVNSALNDCDVIANLKELHSNLVFVLTDKAANNVAIICKKLYALVTAKKLGFNNGNSNDENGTYVKTNSIMGNDIINEHKEYSPNHYGNKRKSKIKTLPLMYWIPKMHTNPAGSRFIIASPKCILKPLSKDITCYI